jgi:hypothetical protein
MSSLIQHRTYRDGWEPATGGFISPAEQDELAGGTVRRWHAYDYTTANVLADGARQLVVEREQRPVTRLRNGGGFGQRIRQAVDAFWQEPEGTAGWFAEDRRRRSISDGDFTGAVLLLEGLIAALDARRPQHRIATTLDELRGLRDRLLAGGDISPDARLYAEHEWENELRFLFSIGVDPRFAERG